MSLAHLLCRAGKGEHHRTSPGGDQIWLKATAESGSITVAEYLSQPGVAGVAPHHHPAHEETFFVLEGQLTMLIEDTIHTLDVGDFALAPRHVAHAFYNAGDVPCRFVATFSPAGFENVFREYTQIMSDGGDRGALRALPGRHGTIMVPWPPGTDPRIT